MQPLFGQVNFVKKFVPGFSQIILALQQVINRNIVFKWGLHEKKEFDLIKHKIINSPSLNTLNFFDNFILYTFASSTSYVLVLTQINNQKIEAPISFLSSNF